MKKRVLNNKGFAVSAILYTAVTLVVLVLILIISILSTIWKSKSLIVDDIKKDVSGIENKRTESLGDVIITSSDNNHETLPDDFGYIFLYLYSDFVNEKNIITISNPCNITINWREIRKGVC